MPIIALHFEVSINRLFPREKLGPQGKDRRWGHFIAAFKPEVHTAESLLAEIRAGHSFCCASPEQLPAKVGAILRAVRVVQQKPLARRVGIRASRRRQWLAGEENAEAGGE